MTKPSDGADDPYLWLEEIEGQRADAWVDPADTEAMYVSIIPREHFSQIKLTMASDLLLLKVDKKGRRLLMEGDSDRYRIPPGDSSRGIPVPRR